MIQTVWLWIRHPFGMWKLHHLTEDEKTVLRTLMERKQNESMEKI